MFKTFLGMLVMLAVSIVGIPCTKAQAVGQLYAVARGRMYLEHEGSIAPTVVLVAGGTDSHATWEGLAPLIASFARVCSYDRLGVGASNGPRGLIGFGQAADDLHQLLRAAGQSPPYVFVGHSIGGAICRMYAARYATEVAGMLLIDPTTELAIENFAKDLAPLGFNPQLALHDLLAARIFPKVPLIVLCHDPLWGALSAAQEGIWALGVRQYASLSPWGRYICVRGTGHSIFRDAPDVVVSELRQLMRDVRRENLPGVGNPGLHGN